MFEATAPWGHRANLRCQVTVCHRRLRLRRECGWSLASLPTVPAQVHGPCPLARIVDAEPQTGERALSPGELLDTANPSHVVPPLSSLEPTAKFKTLSRDSKNFISNELTLCSPDSGAPPRPPLGCRSMVGRFILSLALAGARRGAGDLFAGGRRRCPRAGSRPRPRRALHRRRGASASASGAISRMLAERSSSGPRAWPRCRLLRAPDLEGEPVRRRRGQPGRRAGHRPVHPRNRGPRGLDDPFNPAEALPASAAPSPISPATYGNIGLAALTYNGGEGRPRVSSPGRAGLPPRPAATSGRSPATRPEMARRAAALGRPVAERGGGS